MKYLVRYTVNVLGAREVEADSAREAAALVTRARPEEFDFDKLAAEDAQPYATEPDESFIPGLIDDGLDDPPLGKRPKRRHLRALP